MAIEDLRGYNNRYLVKLIEDEEEEGGEGLLLIPDDFSEQSQYAPCRFLGGRPSGHGTATHCLVEAHLLEAVKVNNEALTFVSDHAIVCTWKES